MLNPTRSNYTFIQESFIYNDDQYDVILTPEMYADEDGLDFTGNYIGLLMSHKSGTRPFQLTYVKDGKWEMETLCIREEQNPDENLQLDDPIMIIDEVGKIEEVAVPIPKSNDMRIVEELNKIIQTYIHGRK